MFRRDPSQRGKTGKVGGSSASPASPLARFWRNRRGAFAMQFALLVAPLVICTGLAIDGGRSFLARYELESALDAAALAVGSSTGDDATLNTLAQKYVDTNFKAPDTTTVVLDLTPTTDKVTLKGTTQLSTYFMPLIGVPKVTVSATTEVRRGGSNVEVGLMLDITGSMGSTTDPNSRISSLIRAANSMIDTVVNDVQTPWFSKVAIVPWANNVNVGSYAAALRGPVVAGTAITGATWRSFGPQAISAVSWKKGGSWNLTRASWANSSYAYSVASSNGIQRVTSGTNKDRVMVTTSSSMSLAAGDYISFQGANGGFTALNGVIYRVSDVSGKTFLLKNAANSAYITYTAATTSSTLGTVGKCLNTPNCEWVITTNGANTLAVNDYAYISGVLTGVDSASVSSPMQVATLVASPANSFVVPGTSPATNTTAYQSSTGSVTECYTSACEYQVTTTGAHVFSNADRIYIASAAWGSGTAPTINTAAGSTLAIANAGSNIFTIPGIYGPAYTASYTASSGQLSVCWTSTCEIQITSNAHGIAANDRVYITGVGGMTGGSPTVNTTGNNSWLATNVSANTFTLSGSLGPNYTTAYSSGGTVWCLKLGCQYYRYTAADSSSQIRQISNCVTERIGTDAYTDTAPGTSPLGDDYPIVGSTYNDCIGGLGSPAITDNVIIPLTANKTTLHATINGLEVTGSTAGQIGVGFGWYMLSPNFASVWSANENRPLAYGTPHLTKVMVLMTDGDFNTAHCNGVAAKDYQVGLSNSQAINCNATNGSPYTQASTLCTNMRASGITIYTVGFQVSAGSAPDNFLKACATDVGHYYLASNNTELEQAFASIATNISQLRISK